MIYREHRPPARLRSLVECLWLIRDARARRTRVPEHVIPDACPELIVHLGDHFSRWVEGRWRRQPAAFLVGTLSRPWRLRPGARVLTLGIRFRPAAVTRAFDVDMAAATDREVPLDTVAGTAQSSALVSALGEGTTDSRLFAAATDWLLEHVHLRPLRDDLAERAVRAVLGSHGRVRIEELTERLGVSRRRLERSFARHLGIRPKLFARIIRLQAALATLPVAYRGGAVEWALEAGYFDQAHLARDFRVLAGRRASQPRERDGEMARHFSDPGRLATLLAGE